MTTSRTRTPALTDDAAIDVLVRSAHEALAVLRTLDQSQIDHICQTMAQTAADYHLSLAKLAVEETGRGVVEDKSIKNLFAAEQVWHSIRTERTAGEISRDDAAGLVRIAEPLGVVAGITPVTNPTSTTIFKCLIALKARNPIVFAFHPSAQRCSAAAAQIMLDAARAAGAPEHAISWVAAPSVSATTSLINHDGIAATLATGGAGMVKAAYSTGKPALGVGPGNVPVYVDRTADVARAAHDIVMSKTFDNGMICASEQTVVVDRSVAAELRAEFVRMGVQILDEASSGTLRAALFPVAGKRPDVVGQSAMRVAEVAGLSVPTGTRVLMAPITEIGPEEPFSAEKLFPLLALYVADSTDAALTVCDGVLRNGGLGHTAVIHSGDADLIERFGREMPACRVLVNQPSAMGGIGGVYGGLMPSLTLGCGARGHNSVSHNVSATDLIDIKLVSDRRAKPQWFRVPGQTYFRRFSVSLLPDVCQASRVFIVTDPGMVRAGLVDIVLRELAGRAVEVFSDVEPNPSSDTVERGTNRMRAFAPDAILALGGGSAMDAAKAMWMFYEHPEVGFDSMKQKFLDIRKRLSPLPPLGAKARFIAIPTTSGTGAECTPFAVITDSQTGTKYPLVDYELTPTIAIVDAQFTDSVPAAVAADSGMDALTHAIESWCSVMASPATKALSAQAGRLLLGNLRAAVLDGDAAARELVHDASAVAGMAFANAFLGIVHSLSHAIGAEFGIPHGRANAIMLPHVLRYNAGRADRFPLYPNMGLAQGADDIAAFAREVGLSAATTDEGVSALVREVSQLATDLGIDLTLKGNGATQRQLDQALDRVAERAFNDQCTATNPRQPTIEDLKGVLLGAFDGIVREEEPDHAEAVAVRA